MPMPRNQHFRPMRYYEETPIAPIAWGIPGTLGYTSASEAMNG